MVAVVMAVMMPRGRRSRRVMQLYRLTVRRVEISLAPGFLAFADFGCRSRALRSRNQNRRRTILVPLTKMGSKMVANRGF
jgi:hypothetical protein